MEKPKKILLGVSGGIAAYKAADLASKLTQSGYSVWVVMTAHGQKLIGPATFRSLTQNPVITELYGEDNLPVPHINISEDVDLCVIAPATANIIGKIAGGIADDALTTTVMACTAPRIIVPSMNTNMWNNLIVQKNITILRELGYHLVEPDYGHLACGAEGKGRYPENTAIIQKIEELLGKKKISALSGKKIIITSGGTKEPLDPVRVISNLSSGKMGQALREVALANDAEVCFIEAQTIEQLKQDIGKNFKTADVLIMAAAVSDYRPKKTAAQKIKSKAGTMTIELEKTEDLLTYFSKQKSGQYLVGFCLETENLRENALAKLKAKNIDLIVANSAQALGADNSSVVIIDKNEEALEYNNLPKKIIAEKIIERICRDIN